LRTDLGGPEPGGWGTRGFVLGRGKEETKKVKLGNNCKK